MRAGQKVTCPACNRANVVLVTRQNRNDVVQIVYGDHFKPNNRTWCNNSGRLAS